MVVVDVEASGVNPYKHSLVSVGALPLHDPSLRFYEECRIWDGAHVDPEALKVNGFTEEDVRDSNKQTDGELVEKFLAWIGQFDDRTIAGQNPSFDRDFLQATAGRYHFDWPLAYRTIDVHSVAYTHYVQRGKNIPLANNRSALDLDAIARYCGLGEEPTPHNALTGALYEAEVLSRLLYNKPLFDEFKEYPIQWSNS